MLANICYSSSVVVVVKSQRVGRVGALGHLDVLHHFACKSLFGSGITDIFAMPPSAGPARMLFIGNSLTYWSGGLDSMFRSWGFDAHAETLPGATLARHWRSGNAKAKIHEGWDVVVLQDDLPEYKAPADEKRERWRVVCEHFLPVLSKFLEVVRATDAVPVVYMAHPYERLPSTRLRDICWAHKCAEESLGVCVAPGGLAHSLVGTVEELEELRDALLDDDLEHPSEEGLYLHALTIAAACFGREKLRDLQWAPPALSDECVEKFKQLACDSLDAWRTYPGPPSSDADTSGLVILT